MSIEIVTHLNKAAYLILRGGVLNGFLGKDPYNCKMIIKVDLEVFKNARDGIVKYQDYMKVRGKIKARIKKVYNII